MDPLMGILQDVLVFYISCFYVCCDIYITTSCWCLKWICHPRVLTTTKRRIWTFGNFNHLHKRPSRTTDEFQRVCICAPDDLCTPLFSFTPITHLWQLRKKCALTPLSCSVTPTAAPPALQGGQFDLKGEFSKLSHGSVVSPWLGLFILFFLLDDLCVYVGCWEGNTNLTNIHKQRSHSWE